MKKDFPNKRTQRLQVYLAKCGLGSRRKCEEFIRQGLISINGHLITAMGYCVREDDKVEYRGREVHPVKKKYYIALNKPEKYLCSSKDDQMRKLAGELIYRKIKIPLFHVGRLDYMSCGLIFYTNDGDFANAVSHPRHSLEKEYIVKTKRNIDETLLEKYRKGISIKGIKYKLGNYELIDNKTCRLILTEGKNREIRRVFQHFGFFIKKIFRKRIGCVSIKGLKSGEFRNLNDNEVKSLMKSAWEHV